MKQIRFTKEGYDKLKKDYADLVEGRKFAVEDLQKARAMGDLSENGYYKAAKMKLSTIDRNLRIFSSQLQDGIVMTNASQNTVAIGNRVTLSDGKTEIIYNIVGDTEADPGKQKISLLSPIGKAIEGKKANDEVHMQTPSGEMKYRIVSIS